MRLQMRMQLTGLLKMLVEERRRRWEEENPTPDQLGDSFGELLKDVVSGIGSVVSGSGDFISFLDEL